MTVTKFHTSSSCFLSQLAINTPQPLGNSLNKHFNHLAHLKNPQFHFFDARKSLIIDTSEKNPQNNLIEQDENFTVQCYKYPQTQP